MIKFSATLLLLMSSFVIQAFAQTTPSLEFLTIGSSTKQLALGEATTAIPIDGLNALVNPATISGIQTNMFSANYTTWGVLDTKISSFSAVLKEGNHSLSFSLLSNTTDGIAIRSNSAAGYSEGSIDYMAISTAYAYGFKYISLGVSASYVNEQYVINSASGYALGFGAYSSLFRDRIRLGASVNHVGEMSKLNTRASKLPTQARIGLDADVLSISIPGDYSFPLLVSTTVDYTYFLQTLDLSLSDNNIIQNEQALFVGLRLFAADLISLNGGYRLLSESNRSWSAGIGIYKGDFKFDFAFIPFDTGFNTAYSIGIRYLF